MTTMDHSRSYARPVHDLPAELRVIDQPPRRRTALHLNEVLAFTANLTAAGYNTGDAIERIEAINDAVDRLGATRSPLDTIDLATAQPEDIAEQVRQVGMTRAAEEAIYRVRDGLQFKLAAAAADHLKAESDRIVRAMRKRFDPAAATVQAASAAGLTQHTDTTRLLDTAPAEVIDAYRALAPAVAQLDAIAGLRNGLTSIAGVGPLEHPMAAYVTDVRSLDQLDGAQNLWTGEVETVQRDMPLTGSHLARVRRNRLGGAWLALVSAGYKLRLNTGAEAHAVVAATR